MPGALNLHHCPSKKELLPSFTNKQADRWIFSSPYDCGSFRIWTYKFSGEGQCSCQVRPRSLDSGPLGKGYKWTSLLPLLCDLINEFFKLCNTYWHLPCLGTPSSTLAWKIPWTEEPGKLQSMGSLRVGHGWVFTFTHQRRKWQPTPVSLPGESQGRGSLVGCHVWGHRVEHDWSDLATAAY